MKKLFLCILFVFFIQPAFMAEAAPGNDESGVDLTALEMRLIEKINNARENPLETASKLGMDTDKILDDFPELKDILINGLPPFEINMMLVQAAKNHTADMIDNHYYSHESPDGRTFYERFTENGYVYTKAGETLGMLSFLNYVDGNAAVDFIFENMFRDELDPARDKEKNILNPQLEDIGIGIKFGTISLNDGPLFNSCVVTCDFGASSGMGDMLDMMSAQLGNLINQARVRPLDVAKALGLDIEEIVSKYPELAEIFAKGLPPLGRSDKIATSAKLHVQDMFDQYYYSEISPDGRTAGDRMAEQGYVPVAAGEILEWSVFDNSKNIEETVKEIFAKIFVNDLKNPDDSGQRILLNPDYNDMGTGIDLGIQKTESGSRLIFVVAIDFAGKEDSNPCVSGFVYNDNNDNGLYDPGEEVSNISVILTGAKRYDFSTDDYGRFYCVPDLEGSYLAILRLYNRVLLKRVNIYDKSAGIYFVLNKGA